MGSSFTEFQGNGFWCRDPALEIWLYLLVQEIDKHRPLPQWLAAARAHWLECATIGFCGCIHADLDNILSDEHRVDTAVVLAQEALHSLKQQGRCIRRGFLSENRIGGPDSYFTRDAETLPLLLIGEEFIKLLLGQCTPRDGDLRMFGNDKERAELLRHPSHLRVAQSVHVALLRRWCGCHR
jgi:hypothetical protein